MTATYFIEERSEKDQYNFLRKKREKENERETFDLGSLW
jgi:hypothetical protein